MVSVRDNLLWQNTDVVSTGIALCHQSSIGEPVREAHVRLGRRRGERDRRAYQQDRSVERVAGEVWLVRLLQRQA